MDQRGGGGGVAINLSAILSRSLSLLPASFIIDQLYNAYVLDMTYPKSQTRV